MDDDFARMWEEEVGRDNNDPTPQELEEKTPEYLIRDARARWKLFASIMAIYFFARHGEPMADLYFDEQHCSDSSNIEFQLRHSEK